MTFPDRGLRPAYNVQFATDTRSQIIVGLDADDELDNTQLGPMVDQLQARYGRAPAEHLVDQGYRNFGELARLAGPACGATLYMPVPKPRGRSTRDRHRPRRHDPPAVAERRVRMGTPEAKAIYGQRASTAECVNAIARNRGLRAFRVRGRGKVKAVLLWFALAHNPDPGRDPPDRGPGGLNWVPGRPGDGPTEPRGQQASGPPLPATTSARHRIRVRRTPPSMSSETTGS